ncbi:MAG TPA: hypothetical protein VD788_17125 [Candidatus Polarisedimenticolaceae bacterium]|nr:hypothetical protein [Candidatus Polarisedimenticolaceae bacterium]
MTRRFGLIALVVLVAAATQFAAMRLHGMAGDREPSEQLLYLPNGKYLELASLGQAPLLADLIYLWAIQYYAEYQPADRHRFVEHVFSDVIAELDPHFVDAYWLGALILITEAGEFEEGIALLEQGFAANPDKWILAYLAAWECALAGQPIRAAGYFAQAEAVDDAPPYISRMRAAMFARAGDLVEALGLWRGIYEDPDADPSSRAIAERKVRELTVQIDLRALAAAVERFRADNRRYPETLADLRRRGYIRDVPRHPNGKAYDYDPRSGSVSAPRRNAPAGSG